MAKRGGGGGREVLFVSTEDDEVAADSESPKRARAPKRSKIQRIEALLEHLTPAEVKALPTLAAAEIERRVRALRGE